MKITTNKYFMLAVLSAAVAVWGFFSINSAFADKHHLNGASVALGIVGIVGIFYFLRKA